MELQLGLALPTLHSTKGFDLNNLSFESRETLALESCRDGDCSDAKRNVKSKRGFDEAFGKIRDDQSRMMPLLLWSGQPNEEDDQAGKKKRTSSISNNNEEEKQVVGWPPIQSWRKKLLLHHHHQQQHHHQHQGQVGRIENNNRMADQKENGGSNSMYVKVKMEGVAIARKIDLRCYHSFRTLTDSMIAMFAQYQKCSKHGERYTLTYKDKEGNWLLARDVPWQTFIESVQRLEILKNEG